VTPLEDPLGLQEQNATFTIPKEPVRRRVHGIESGPRLVPLERQGEGASSNISLRWWTESRRAA